MSAHLIDTSILIDLLRGYTLGRDWLRAQKVDERLISIVTVYELVEGCANLRTQKNLENQLSGFTIVPISEAISTRAQGLLMSHHLRSGVGYPDCLIGATALELGLTLFTLNIKHFRVFEGLRVERPY